MDGNTADYSKDFAKGTLNGVKASYPGAELTGDFKQRMLKTDPKLTDFTYGPESYDATVLTALAAIAGQVRRPDDVRSGHHQGLGGRHASAPRSRSAPTC